jgi:hypothetical protein
MKKVMHQQKKIDQELSKTRALKMVFSSDFRIPGMVHWAKITHLA